MSKRKKVRTTENFQLDLDENFYFIAGHTPAGFAYGTTWEEAREMGLVKDESKENNNDDMPF